MYFVYLCYRGGCRGLSKEALALKRMIAGCLLLTLPLLSACSLVPQEEVLPQMPVIQQIEEQVTETVQVMRGDLALEKIFSCTYQPAEEEKLYFPVNGQAIDAIYVKRSDTVKKGDLIAELDNTGILQQIEGQQQTLDSLNLQIVQQQNYMKIQQQRIDTLTELAALDPSYEARIASAKQSLESRDSQLTLLYAQLSVEKTALSELEEDLKYRQLYAGIDGTVSYTLDLGSSTVYTKNQLICTIQNLGQASFVGFFQDGLITVGQKLTLRNNDKETEVIATSLSEPDKAGNVSVSFALVTPDASLKAGDTARVTLVTEQLENVLFLPNSAIHKREGGAFVYYLDEKGIIAVKPVEIGSSINGYTHIISGLTEGETLLMDAP